MLYDFAIMKHHEFFNTMNDMIHATSSIDLSIPTAVAVSGGVDSMCLLHLLAQYAHEQNQVLWVFHIHHDLQTVADEWQTLVHDTAQRLNVSFDTQRLDATTRVPAQSTEEWARRGRYDALAKLAQQHGVRQIALAHHQDDQIETYLLQTERGAGARGRSAMPRQLERHGVGWLRPWLDVPKSVIVDYANQHDIAYLDDPSNNDERFSRNAIRARLTQAPLNIRERRVILDAIHTAQREQTEHSAWAQSILAQHQAVHRADIGECGRLRGIDLAGYSPEQATILLREWMAQMGWRMPSRAAVNELLKQLSQPTLNRQMCWRHPDGWGVTQLKNNWIAAQLLPSGEWFLTEPLRQRIQAERLTVHPRKGGETFKLAANRPSISLKHAYQMYEIAPMLRGQLPLLYAGERLVHVVGVGDVLDAR